MRGLFTSFVCALSVAVLPGFLLASPDAQPGQVAARAKRAERIVVARVSDVHASYGTNEYGDSLIISKVVLDVDETWKGPQSNVLTAEIEGGTVGDVTLQVSDMPELQQGQRGVFFLSHQGKDRLVLHDRGHGHMKLESDDRIAGSPLKLADVKSLVSSAIR